MSGYLYLFASSNNYKYNKWSSKITFLLLEVVIMNASVPIHIFSGFLGSGKTTLLKRVLDYYKETGRKPAVVMNELGDVNLDGLIVGEEVALAEMLSGCICCTIRGDLGMTIQNLYLEQHPDVIIIESTGVANPMEIIDGVTDASMILEVDLKSMITVIDSPHLLELSRSKSRKTYQLMQDQIRCANLLIFNKIDKVTSEELSGLEHIVRAWNPYAPLVNSVHCDIDMDLIEQLSGSFIEARPIDKVIPQAEEDHTDACDQGDHHTHDHTGGHQRAEDKQVHDKEKHRHHHSHDHVMVYTHYFDHPIDSDRFEDFVSKLPKEVYRAKGILQFLDTAETSRFLFQFAYREMEFIKITPQANVPNVAVFIGENFSKAMVKTALDEL
jgi:G3E family GTPase